jgi:predicted transcriptional regulator
LGEIQQPRLAVRRGKICRSANEFENIARSEGLVTEGDVERATEMLRAYLSTVEHGNIVPSLENIERFLAALESATKTGHLDVLQTATKHIL